MRFTGRPQCRGKHRRHFLGRISVDVEHDNLKGQRFARQRVIGIQGNRLIGHFVDHQQQDIYRRVKALNVDSGIFFGQVDREFYNRYPEMKDIPLTNTSRHRKYRRTWYQIAEDLLQQQENQ